MFNGKNRLEIQAYENRLNELIRKREEKKARYLKKLRVEQQRGMLFFGIGFVLLFVFLLTQFYKKIILNEWLTKALIFLMIVLMYEFVIVILEPYLIEMVNGSSILKYGVYLFIGMLIFPIHLYYDSALQKRITDKFLKEDI